MTNRKMQQNKEQIVEMTDKEIQQKKEQEAQQNQEQEVQLRKVQRKLKKEIEFKKQECELLSPTSIKNNPIKWYRNKNNFDGYVDDVLMFCIKPKIYTFSLYIKDNNLEKAYEKKHKKHFNMNNRKLYELQKKAIEVLNIL